MSQRSGKLRSFVSAFQQASGDASGGSFKSESPQRPMVGPNGGEDRCFGISGGQERQERCQCLELTGVMCFRFPLPELLTCITWPGIATCLRSGC